MARMLEIPNGGLKNHMARILEMLEIPFMRAHCDSFPVLVSTMMAKHQ